MSFNLKIKNFRHNHKIGYKTAYTHTRAHMCVEHTHTHVPKEVAIIGCVCVCAVFLGVHRCCCWPKSPPLSSWKRLFTILPLFTYVLFVVVVVGVWFCARLRLLVGCSQWA